ncbi:leucine-rich repeat domain-containing protein [Chryseolinea serpens]|uniref:leucine-rich repeat domain-containing protein n=1 Tax=Chryseolinea serpens TaxID=947013 RepID=UPI0015BD9A75|nr:leucine-rich repeat domain-containing protein [Chryseolinea serpens]
MRLAFTTPLVAFLLSHAAFSQVRLITGRLLDAETQKPVKGATVSVLDTTDGTISSPFGYFQIKIDPSKHKTLVVSHIGFKTADVTIPEADNFKFFLKKAFVFLQPLDLNLYPKDPTAMQPLQEQVAPADLAEANATFPGGLDAFYTYIGNALSKEIPPLPFPNFTITFTIDENGKASNLAVSDSTHRVVVERVFQNMPAWVAATQHGTNVAQHFSLPIGITPTAPTISISVSEFATYMAQNLRFPAEARSAGVEGVVYVQFRLDGFGKVISVMLLKDIGMKCGDEVRRVLLTLPPNLGMSLAAKTKASDFILPVSFGIGKPFETEISFPGTDARLLTEIQLTAMSVERVQRATPPQYIRQNSRAAAGSKVATEEFVSLEEALKSKATRLSLIDKRLNSFPPEILQLKELTYLDLEKNQLNHLPDDLHSLTKLQELYLFENKIETLPSTFGNLKKLKVLGLGSNQLKTFPEEITQLEKLETLDLGGNKITSLPPSIAALKNLKFLVLHDNNITHIPEAIYELKKLQKIYLQGNPIAPKDLERLRRSFDKAKIVL